MTGSTSVGQFRETVMRAIRFESPAFIPVSFVINPSCWHCYNTDELRALIATHQFLFPHGCAEEQGTPTYALNQRADTPYTDPWGCVWSTTCDGITGSVHTHPLNEWTLFDGYTAPDPDTTDGTFPVCWDDVRIQAQAQRERGELVWTSLPHGHTFLRAQDLRGYENLMYDMTDDVPHIQELFEMIATFNLQVVQNYMTCSPDIMGFPDDLGMQSGPMIAPTHFARYVAPIYQRLMAEAHAHGCAIHMHTDGDIRALADDLDSCGIDVLQIQDLVNGVEWIAEHYAGRRCTDVDIDRQKITPRGTPVEIDAHIRTVVEKVGRKEGGLMLTYGLYPGVPIENIAALMDALERYTGYYT